MTRYRSIVILFCFSLLFGACLMTNYSDDYMGIENVDLENAWQQTGLASWYGEDFHGRKTASGEEYDMNAFTGAHRTLPFGTIVLVQNLQNDTEVRVRINDRGPFKRGRIIDLSYAAAKRLDMLKMGVIQVKIYVLILGK